MVLFWRLHCKTFPALKMLHRMAMAKKKKNDDRLMDKLRKNDDLE